MDNLKLPGGNELVSLPSIDAQSAGIEDVTFLHMGYKGLIDLRGPAGGALIAPWVQLGGQAAPLHGLTWARPNGWTPKFRGFAGTLPIEGTYLSPIGERGLVVQLVVHNTGTQPVALRFGLRGEWAGSWHCVNEEKEIEGTRHCTRSGWNDSIVFDHRCGVPLYSFAPMADRPCESAFTQTPGGGISYTLTCSETLAPGAVCTLNIYWGFGFEEVAAATSAKEMLRQGYAREWQRTCTWLAKRSIHWQDEALSTLYNTNLFFCIFFSTGITLDTEELVLVTSRSPRYYVSAAYWDRDSLLWSFPAILAADVPLAKQMLLYAFGRQRRNFGVHSRFIDGTVLEPGFELDELMAPLLALERYVEQSGDTALLAHPDVVCGIEDILQKLALHKAPDTELYETFLQPTDDEHVYPYLTYDNVLVWRALQFVARAVPGHAALQQQAQRVKEAILAHCVVKKGAGAPYFAWSVDLAGHHDVYDEPPGSLQLLPTLGFCSPQNETWQNTVALIRAPGYQYSFAGSRYAEIGCPHAPHPWILSVANSLLCGRVAHSLAILRAAPMDGGIACESIDEETGVCTSGEAFATCAGFLCYSLRNAMEGGEARA